MLRTIIFDSIIFYKFKKSSSVKNFLSFFLFLLFVSPAFSQQNTVHSLGVEDVGINDAISTFNKYVPKTQGSTYFYDVWCDAILTFESGKKSSRYKARYDIINQTIEVNVEGVIYDLPSNLIESFVLEIYRPDGTFNKTSFINTRGERDLKNNASTFLEIVAESEEIMVFKSVVGEILKPNYVTGLDVGSQDSKVIKKDYYYWQKGNEFSQMPKNKKELVDFVKGFSPKTYDFLIKEKLNLKKKRDLAILWSYINNAL